MQMMRALVLHCSPKTKEKKESGSNDDSASSNNGEDIELLFQRQ